MSLRPRYSLITLLVLTALIAGGVKLWYGPHHVVERTNSGDEIEYTYTRDWRGKRVVDGPLIRRDFTEGQLFLVEVYCYRQGLVVDWRFQGSVLRESGTPQPHIGSAEECPLTAQERQVLEDAFKKELQRVEAAGMHHGLTVEGPNNTEGVFDAKSLKILD